MDTAITVRGLGIHARQLEPCVAAVKTALTASQIPCRRVDVCFTAVGALRPQLRCSIRAHENELRELRVEGIDATLQGALSTALRQLARRLAPTRAA